MTRTGKIARLPHGVREELNQRLQNGEKGKSLLKWLNGLPTVKKVLRREFEGEPISESNLSQWRQGGYPDWVAGQEALDGVREMMTEAGELEDEGHITDRLSLWLTARCALAAEALMRKGGAGSVNGRAFQQLCRNVVALRRGDHYARWIAIEQERMEAERPDPKKLEKQFREWARDPKIQEEFFGKPRMTWEERDEAFRQVLGLPPREKEPEAKSGTVAEGEKDESESEGSDPNSGPA